MTLARYIRLLSYSAMLVIFGGCTEQPRAATPTTPPDVGATYVAPADTGPATIEGIEYEYVATDVRERAITAGFSKLKVGQGREQVREAMGVPDLAEPRYDKDYTEFRGWKYTYEIRRRAKANRSNICVQIFFDEDGNLIWAVPNHIAGLTEVGHHSN